MNERLDSVILFLLDQTSKVAKQYSQREFEAAKLGITVDQWVLMKIIEENKIMSQAELAVKSTKDPASITRILDLLQKKELINREPIEGNRRQYNIRLTKKGYGLIEKNTKMVNSHRAKSIKNFTSQELAFLKDMLLRIQRNMK